MTGEIGQIKPQETMRSDIEAVASPVQEQAVAGPAAGILDMANTAFNVAMPFVQKQRQQASEAAQLEAKNEFSHNLLKASSLADKYGAESARMKTFLTEAYVNSGLDPDIKAKMLKDFQTTALGKPLVEESPEQKAFDKLTGEAVARGFIPYNATPDQVEQGTLMMQRVSAQTQVDQAKLASIQLQNAELKLKSDKSAEDRRLLEEGRKELESGRWDALVNLSIGYTPTIKNSVNKIVQQYREGVLDRAGAEEQLKLSQRDLSATVGQLVAGMPKGSADPLVQPMMDVYNIAIESLDSSSLLQDIENQNKLMVAKAKRNQLLSSNDLVNFVANSSLSNHSSPALIAKMSEESVKVLKRQSEVGVKPADVTEQTEDMATYLEVLTNGIQNRGTMLSGGVPAISQEELNRNISNTLSGANRYISDEDKPTQNKMILKWLAAPEVGGYVKESLSEMPASALAGLTNTLTNSAVNHIYPKVQDITSSDIPDGEGVEMMNFGGQVSFRATSADPWDKSTANKLNNEVAGALTTYFRAIANVSSDSFDQVFDRERATAWPSKYGEETTQEEVQTQSVDYSQYEGRTGRDQEGNIVTVRNGVLVKVGGTTDAREPR